MKVLKLSAPHAARTVLTMVPDGAVGFWRPATAEDRRLLRRVCKARDGDLVDHPDRLGVAFLVALCSDRGVAVQFDPAPGCSPPLPAKTPRSCR